MRLLTVAFTLASASMAAAIVHLVPFLVDHGWSTVTAAWAAGILGATQVAARIAFGPATRRLSTPTLATAVLALPAAGALVLAFSAGRPTVWLAVALLGAGQGTATLLRPALLSQRHGPDGYGRLAATSAATSTVARATAPLALAAIAGTGGRHYTAGLAAFAMLGAAGALVARYATGRPHEDASPPRTGSLPAHT